MNQSASLIGAAALVAVAAWWMFKKSQEEGADEEGGGLEDIGDSIVDSAKRALGLWRAPDRYAVAIADAERASGLPPLMLERLLWQESRYREDVITGAKRSPVGAMGIAQFMPATAAELRIDPLNPAQAIPAAARYLRGLYQRFGSWSEALAAYNWGQGNVARKGLAAAPAETRSYYSQILADVNSAAGSNLA